MHWFVCLSYCLGQCEYEDSIEFQSKDGSFQVCLRATIPCYALEVPDSVLLPLCAVQHSSHTTFQLKNARCVFVCVQGQESKRFFFFHITAFLFISPSLLFFLLSYPLSAYSSSLSKLQTCFQWVCAAPFQLSPEHGLLNPSQECHITVVFRPQEALVYQQQAYCRFGEEGDKAGSCCTVLLQALGTKTNSLDR